MAGLRRAACGSALKSAAHQNIPPNSVNRILYAFDFAGEFIDCPDEAFVDVLLRHLLLRIAKKKFYARSRLPHDHHMGANAASIGGVNECSFDISCKIV